MNTFFRQIICGYVLTNVIVKPSVLNKCVVKLEKNCIRTTLVRRSLMSVSSKHLYTQKLMAVDLN